MKEDWVIEHELIMWFELKKNLLMISKKTWIIFEHLLFVQLCLIKLWDIHCCVWMKSRFHLILITRSKIIKLFLKHVIWGHPHQITSIPMPNRRWKNLILDLKMYLKEMSKQIKELLNWNELHVPIRVEIGSLITIDFFLHALIFSYWKKKGFLTQLKWNNVYCESSKIIMHSSIYLWQDKQMKLLS